MKIKTLILMFVALMPLSVFAQPSTTVGTGSGLAGSSVNITVDYAGVASVVGVQVDIEYNATLLTPTINCGSLATVLTCATTTNTGGQDVVRIIGFNIPTATIADGSLATIDFAIGAGAPLGLIPLTVSGEVYDDGAPPGDVPPSGSVSGSVTVISGPQPDWSSAPAGGSTLTFATVIAGGTDPTQLVTVTNAGAVGSTLTGTCALSGATDPELTISSGAAISLADGLSSDVNLSCDATAAGTFTGSLDCTHNGDGTTEASPVSYPLTCTITPPGAAQYASTPADGAVINMTSGTGVLVGSMAPTTTIDITNPAPNSTDNDLGLEACTYAGDAAISVTSTDPLTTSIAPQSAATETVAFSCSTAAVGMYTGTYSCPYSTDGAAGSEGTASYTVNCDIRAAASAGSPANGTSTNANITAPPGGSSPATTVLSISETLGEGADLQMVNCSLATGTDFVLGAVPGSITSGSTQAIDVTFTDPGVPGPYTDVLTCNYVDSAGAATVTVNLSGSVQAIIVPTLSYLGYAAMILGLLFVGFVGFRRRA